MFRGLLSVHSRYGLSARRVAQRRPLTPEAPTASWPPPPLPPAARVPDRLERPLAGRDSHPLKMHAFSRRTEKSGLTGAGERLAPPCRHPAARGLRMPRTHRFIHDGDDDYGRRRSGLTRIAGMPRSMRTTTAGSGTAPLALPLPLPLPLPRPLPLPGGVPPLPKP
jgi:hypothetical protein